MYNDMYLDIVNQQNDINLVLEPTRKGHGGGGRCHELEAHQGGIKKANSAM